VTVQPVGGESIIAFHASASAEPFGCGWIRETEDVQRFDEGVEVDFEQRVLRVILGRRRGWWLVGIGGEELLFEEDE